MQFLPTAILFNFICFASASNKYSLYHVLKDPGFERCMQPTNNKNRLTFKADNQIKCAKQCTADSRSCVIFSYYTESKTCVISDNIFEELITGDLNCKTYQSFVYPKSCNDILDKYPYAASGLYNITVGFQNLQVWCDMKSNEGGYTFLLNDANFNKLYQRTLDLLFTNRTHYLLVLKRATVQNYCNVTQLDQYRDILFKSFIRTATIGIPADYHPSENALTIGPPYIMWPVMTITQGSTQVEHGIKLNGKKASGIPLDTAGREYIALFPKSTGATNFLFNNMFPMTASVYGNCDAILNKVMPNEAFFFLEMHFSGGMTYTQTDGRADALGVLAANIGVK